MSVRPSQYPEKGEGYTNTYYVNLFPAFDTKIMLHNILKVNKLEIIPSAYSKKSYLHFKIPFSEV
jgi:hypothetical protein